jgi:fructose-1,6-bisphosphatase/inositol monophosphatase family enzyme
MDLEDIKAVLIKAKKKLTTFSGKGEEIIEQGAGFGDSENDTDIFMDRYLGEFFREKFLEFSDVGQVVVEGLDSFEEEGGSLIAFVDPLDNSQAYFCRENTQGFPFSSCVSVAKLRNGGNCLFRDFILAGVIDHRNGDLWLGRKNPDGSYESFRNGERLLPNEDDLDVASRKDVIITDLYYFDNRHFLPIIFPEEKGIFRNPGSAALEMVYTTYDRVALYFCFHQKSHELSASYVINKGAGREVLHLDSKEDLMDYTYSFNEQLPVLIARNKKVAEDFFSRMDG